MVYNIEAKPTIYNGIKFRSRLEAKWAVFFDAVGWHYIYEPSEINGYNPDFIVKCKSKAYKGIDIIVEVKPSVLLSHEEIDIILNKYKVVKSHLLILTDTPFYETLSGLISIGIGYQYGSNDPETLPETYDLEMKCLDDFGSSYMVYDGMIKGNVDREQFISEKEAIELKLLWNRCGNIVQFNVNK